jgi:hypothetical protein
MDYGNVLARAWQISWRWKVLWILGLLAGLGRVMSGGSNSQYTTSSGDWGGPKGFGIPPEVAAALAGVACLGIIVAIALWVVSVIARGGLIAGVQQVEDEGETSFGSAWRAGARKFWTLFGIGILAAIPMILALLLGVFVLGSTFLAGMQASSDASFLGRLGGVLAPLACCSVAFLCGLMIVALILAQIRIYAERAAIIEDLGWIDAFKRGWEVLKENLGPTIILWIIFFVIALGLALLIGGAMAVMMLPFLALLSNTDPPSWAVGPLCCGGVILVVVFAAITAFIETFTSATWTLAYRDLTGLDAQPGLEPVAEE